MNSLIKRFARTLLQFISDISNGKLSSFVLDLFTPRHRFIHGTNRLFFYTPNHLTYWRAKTLLKKEPETITWLDEHVRPGEVLYDIGANIGCYSMYAAGCRRARVLAFEPAYMNYYILCKNVGMNRVNAAVTPYMIAFSDASAVTDIAIPKNVDGAACTTIDAAAAGPADFNHGVVSYALDDFVALPGVPFPDHIKIDVDGIEAKIVAGGRRTFQDRRLRTVQIEINDGLAEDRQIVSTMEALGFRILSKKNGPSYQGDSKYKDVFNYLFVRG
jgi:FkbM family methyltransferase